MIYTEIVSGLWVGDIQAMSTKQFLHDQSITYILNCCQGIPIPEVEGIQVSCLGLSDQLIHNMRFFKQHHQQLLNHIHGLLDDHNVLIGCYDGQTLSTYLVCLYLLRYGSIQPRDVKSIILSKNPQLSMDYDISLFQLDSPPYE